MNRELITDPLDRDDLWSDMRTNIGLLLSRGYNQALVFFGFAWGKHFYDDNWYDMPMALDALETRVREAEEKGWGRLGQDNLYITLEQLPIRLSYSHEADIHLSYADEDDIVRDIRSRWLAQGWLTETLRSKNYQR